METTTAQRIARRFVGLPLDQRRQILEKMQASGQSFRLLPIAVTRHEVPRIPLSHAQQQMLILWQLEPRNSAYNVPMAVRLSGGLDEPALGRALEQLVRRHESLRTRFVSVDGVFHQEILEQSGVNLVRVDVLATGTDSVEEHLKSLVRAELSAPFDLLQGPLLRVRLFRLGEAEHVLTLCMHHIISDGWSGEVLVREFIRFYQGPRLELPALPIQYADFAIWQRAWLEAGEGERQLAYWKAQLGDEHPLLELPLDHERPAHPSYRGAIVHSDLTAALSAQLKSLARQNGQTLFMLSLAALAVVLSRYSGQADIRIGAPNAGRSREELEGLIGFFVNTQVLRVQVDERVTFQQLLEQVKQVVSGAQSHQELPFEQLVEALAPERHLGHNPLFQVKINQNVLAAASAGDKAHDLSVEAFAIDVTDARFDLALDFTDTAQGIEAGFTYATDLFEAATIERLAASWRQVLEQLAHAAEQPLLAQPAGAARAIEHRTAPWPFTDFLALWEQGRRIGHGRPALHAAGQAIDYDELERRSNRLAHYLRAQGLGRGDVIALCQERSFEWVVGLLAVLKTGAVYLPLDTAQPRERLQQLLKDSAATLLMHAPGDAKSAGLGICPVLAHDPGQWADCAAEPLAIRVLPEQPAYIIYTSGSTGQPKGVLISHRALANYVQALLQRLDLASGASLALVSTIAADLGHTQLFGALASGRPLHLMAAEHAFDPDGFAAYMAEHRVDVLKIVPSHLQGLLQAARPADVLPRQLLVLGGEASPWALIEQIRRLAPECRIVNHYGPTETTVGILTHEVQARLAGCRTVPVGWPLANAQARVLDAWLNPVAERVAGDLYLGGAGLAQGYLGRAAMTAERFVPDPESLHGERLYRAGDRARLSDGWVEYLGRADDQVKIRGYRVEPGEVAQVLQGLDDVREAVVLALPLDSDASRLQLVAYCVPEAGTELAVETLRQSLLAELPEYLVPAHIVALERLPLTANGKLDKRALPKPGVAGKRYTAPVGEIEEKLAAVWADVLKLERVGSSDNFFELGGDSILSLQIIARAKRQGIKLSPRQLFEKQTIGQLATVARLIEKKAEVVEVVQGSLPLLPIQARFFELEIPQRQHWNQALMLEPSTTLEPEHLRNALHMLIERHEALRLGFEQRDGVWQASFGTGVAIDPLWVHELDDPARLRELADEAQRSLDLKQGPLLRALLVNLPQGQRLLLVIHHLAVDGVSWRVLLEDLQQAYTALAAGRSPVLAPRSSSLKAWAEHLQAYARGPLLKAERNYWLQSLGHAEGQLPRDNPLGANTRRQVRHARSCLSKDLTQQLLKVAPAAYRTQVNDLLLTALARVLCAWSGQASALIQLEGHGREDLFEDLDLSRTVGWFSSLFPLRLTPCAELGASIRRIKEQLRAVPNKGIGYGILRYLGDAGTVAALQALPEARVTFNYLGQFDAQAGPGERVLLMPSADDCGASQNEDAPLGNWLSLNGQVYDGRLQLDWSFSGEVYHAETIERLAAAYEQALAEVIGHCLRDEHHGVTPSDFPLAGLDQAQLDRLPVAARDIEDVYPLSPMQQGMLFHSLSAPASGNYLNQMRVDVTGLDVPRFRAAWQAAIERHEALRARFAEGRGQPLQVIRKTEVLAFAEEDLRGRDGLEALLAELAEADLRRGFDLAGEPLLRLTVLRTAERGHHLIYTNHHILLDGWSSARLLGEVLEHYNGHIVTPPGSRLCDYIQWLQRQDSDADQRFWREQMAAFDEPTRLVQAFKAGGVVNAVGHGEHRQSLDAARTLHLGEFAREQRVTLNTLLQATWLLLLQRYTGQRSVTLGATVSGRPADLPGVEEQLGLFINTLPVLGSPGPELRVGDWLQQVQARNLALREHQHTPLYDIQRWAGWSGEALFDTLLVFENYPTSQVLEQGADNGLAFSDLQSREQTHYPLTLVVEVGEVMSVDYRYARQQLSDAAVAQLAGHFEHLLLALAGSAEQRLGELPMLAEAETRQTLREWNRTQADYPAPGCLHRLIEAQVRRSPEAPALLFDGQQLSYRQLNGRANQLAHRLRERGVGPDVLVGIAAERSLEMVIGLLAILKAGGAYVPLDPEYPRERLAYMIEDSGIELLLTQRHLLETLPIPEHVQCLCLDVAEPVAACEDNPRNLTLPDHLAYVIYTSGSTGRPKGAGNSHRALYNRLAWMQKAYALQAQDTVLQKTPFSFDVSVWEFFWPLLSGARLAIARPGEHRDPQQLMDNIEGYQVSTLHFVPSMLQVFMAGLDVERCRSIRRLVCSGEALPAELAQEVLKRLPRAALYNLYGPTEAAIDVTHWTCTADDKLSVPIGRPIDNLKSHVLDNGLLPAAFSAAGELYLGGVGLARGYHCRPALTAERFVPDPFDEHGGRLYRSGDLARYRDEGVIEYAGRLDHQIKIRGLRVELGEIEARLQEHPGVREANVIDIDGPLGKQLVAYLVPLEPDLVDAGPLAQGPLREALKAHLKARLPEHMVPAHLVLLECMPLSPNGKLERRALPAPDVNAAGPLYRAPRTELEQRLAVIWAQVLEVERVGLDDNFFERGGHSLLVIALVGRLREAFEVTIKLHDFLLLPNLEALADFLREGQARVKSPVIAMNACRNERSPLFCLPPGGGGAYAYYPLAGALGNQRQVYGLVNKSYVVPGWFDESWDGMVAYYLEQIRATQPHGPYNLLGWSLGGALAIEVAHRLEQAGEPVGFVGLVDSLMPRGGEGCGVEPETEADAPVEEPGLHGPLLSSLLAFVPGLDETTALGFLEQARASLSDEQAVVERVIEQVAELGGVSVERLREIHRDIALQDEIETGYRLLHANALLSEAFSLKPLSVKVDCWWAAGSRSAAQIRDAELRLLRECAVNGLAGSRVLAENHDSVIFSPVLLNALLECLAGR
ncbi:amino acid adenylation domain-containing protein [Pseudomonas sp. MWU13-2105]|uniref:amino acid adenylation domain-containing protein n=1 Tax=Pseudomonas sp. MWU13-2105 TaxID=2935074 RepID=UPI002010C46F|nr:non-ribosomal peptide synthetase [Pseudomonas sp. MWU13-2105]